MDDKTEAQRDLMACPPSQSWQVVKRVLDPTLFLTPQCGPNVEGLSKQHGPG